MMIKRKFVLYVALFAIIIGGAPYFTGYLVEAKFKDALKVPSEFQPVSVTVLEYERGWRKSYAKTRVTLRGKYLQKLVNAVETEIAHKNNHSPLQTPSPQLTIVLEHEIRHGPFVQLQDKNYREWLFALAAVQSKLFLTEESKKILKEEIGETELFTLKSQITIEGAVQTTIEGRPLTLSDSQGKEHIFWKGAQGRWQLSRDMKHLQGEMLLPGFDFELDNTRYYGEEVGFKTERFKTPEGLWLGKGTFRAQNLTVKESPTNVVKLSLSGVVAGSLMDTEESMVDTSGNLRIEQIKYADKSYGPVNVAGTLKNVEPRVMKSFFELNQRVHFSDKSPYAIYLNGVIALLPDLLTTRPELNVEGLSIRTQDGDIKGFLNFTVGGPQANDVGNFSQIVQSIAAKANVTFPKIFLRDLLSAQYANEVVQQNGKESTPQQQAELITKKVNETIATQLAAGTLIETDQNYLVEMQFQQGKLAVNGKAVELSSHKSPLSLMTSPRAPLKS